jgi:hypothetical membrane protein
MSTPRLRIFGVLGLAGAVFFLLSILALHALRPDVDVTTHFISDFVNGPGGWLFVVAALIHGVGNIGLSLALRQSLPAGEWSAWASSLLLAAALGILIAAIFPTDPAGSATWIGVVHSAAVAGSFVLELAALFLFALACGEGSVWKPLARHCLSFAISAAVGLSLFFFLLLLEQLQGLGERAALLSFMAWEIWVSIGLIRLGSQTKPERIRHLGHNLPDGQHPAQSL